MSGNVLENNRDVNYIHRETCRICGSKQLYKFLELGPTPLANSFLREDQLKGKEDYYPLDMYFCRKCHLVQLSDIVNPEVMFKDYPYITGTSKPMQKHFFGLAKEVIHEFNIDKNDLIVDIGSNDGTLLQNFSNHGISTLGVEPASNISKLAEQKGISTINRFFNEECAKEIRNEFGPAKAITATNVFAHADDLNGILHGVDALLSDDGIFVVEVPYLLNLLINVEFDTVYHEHLSYFSLHPLIWLFHNYRMDIVNVKQIPVHGGSLRIFIKRAKSIISSSSNIFLQQEKNYNIDSLATYDNFSKNVKSVKYELVELLRKLKGKGKIISGYGATAKGNTLLNYCKIGPGILDYISDTTPFKQGRYTPGMHIPVVSENEFHANPPDYALLLAWNYAKDILIKEREYQSKGGRFIMPIPEPHIIWELISGE